MRTKLMVLLLLLFALAVLVTGAHAQHGLVCTECPIRIVDNSNADFSYGMAERWSAGFVNDVPGQYPWLANFTYATATSMPTNTGTVNVYLYEHGRMVSHNYFGPGGGFAEYILCDSVRVLKSVAGDVVTIKACH